MDQATRVILIGGSSNVGKTTLARRLAERLGWEAASTDQLGHPHPGRPWGPLRERPHVVAHYQDLSVDELIASVLAHYRGMAPTIEARVRAHALDPAAPGLVMEGSALWPETIAALRPPATAAVWLTADDALFGTRIRAESGHAETDEVGRALIDKFLARTRAYDQAMMQAVRRLGLPFIDVSESPDVEALADACLAAMRPLA